MLYVKKKWHEDRQYFHNNFTTFLSTFRSVLVVVTQLLSRVWLFVSPWTVASQAPLSSTKFQSLLKFMSIKSVMISNHLILCCSLLVLPSIFPSIRVFSNPEKYALLLHWLHESLKLCGSQQQKFISRTSLVVQWLRTCLPMQGDVGLISGPGRLHMPQGN